MGEYWLLLTFDPEQKNHSLTSKSLARSMIIKDALDNYNEVITIEFLLVLVVTFRLEIIFVIIFGYKLGLSCAKLKLS